ncbi:MAG TPA: HAD-IA family hydrolase [Acidobacteriaceae bacterium]|jgi:phosphoglycolate phosphatase
MPQNELPPTVIFDFDGTLIDSKPGILNCLKQTLRGRNLSWEEPLDWFVGPPPHVSMPRLLPHLSVTAHTEIVDEYRALYAVDGWSQSSVYPGVPEMLETLQRSGWRIFICTAKRRDFTMRMLAHFGLEKYFEAVYADSVELPSHSKTELLTRLLTECHVSTDAVMVGDRLFDIEAGKACGLRTIAVTYGYGSDAELRECQPDRLCNSSTEVLEALLEME